MKKAAIMIFPNFCMQEISILTELFLFCGKEITVFAASGEHINSEDGFTVLPHKTFAEYKREEYDCLVLPGIAGYQAVMDDARNIEFLRTFKHDRKTLIASISSSPILLCRAGLLENKKFFGGFYEEDIDKYDFIKRENLVRKPIVKDGNIITAIGFAFKEFAFEVIHALGLSFEGAFFGGITKNYSEEELTYRMSDFQ